MLDSGFVISDLQQEVGWDHHADIELLIWKVPQAYQVIREDPCWKSASYARGEKCVHEISFATWFLHFLPAKKM